MTSVKVEELSIHIKAANGAEVSIAKLGATVYSWKTSDGIEHLFLSKKSGPAPAGSKPLRGGIPICWPVFGPAPKEPPYDKLSQHGFARNVVWQDSGDKLVKDEGDEIVYELSLKPNDSTRSLFTPDFALTYRVALHPLTSQLTTSLHVHNPSSSEKLRFQALLHNYFLLPSSSPLSSASVKSLQSLRYVDKVRQANTFDQEAACVTFPSEVDRVYLHEEGGEERKVVETSWGLKIVKEKGLKEVVVWNPGKGKGGEMEKGDMHEGGWTEFVCVEPGWVDGWVELGSGEEWEARQRLVAPKA